MGVMSPRAGERWWAGVVVRVRSRVEVVVVEGEKSRRVNIVDEVSCEDVPAAEADAVCTASWSWRGDRESEYVSSSVLEALRAASGPN